jgi:hypothetical protein
MKGSLGDLIEVVLLNNISHTSRFSMAQYHAFFSLGKKKSVQSNDALNKDAPKTERNKKSPAKVKIDRPVLQIDKKEEKKKVNKLASPEAELPKAFPLIPDSKNAEQSKIASPHFPTIPSNSQPSQAKNSDDDDKYNLRFCVFDLSINFCSIVVKTKRKQKKKIIADDDEKEEEKEEEKVKISA